MTLLIGSLSASLVQPLFAAEDFGEPASGNWPLVGGDWGNRRYSSLSKIDLRNVKALRGAWVSERFEDDSISWTTPVVKDGVMFLTAGRKIYALNAKTGVKIWVYQTLSDIAVQRQSVASGSADEAGTAASASPNWKGVGVGQGLVFVGLQDGHLMALQERTGKLAWIVQTGIRQPRNGQRAAVAPTYINGVVFTGLSDGDYYQRGRLTALDAKTGNQLWQIFTIPAPDEPGHETWPEDNDAWKFGGGGVWTPPTVDPELGLVYATTGNAVPAHAGDWRPGDNLYTCSVLAVDIKTGAIKWYYQLIHHDVFEADLGTPLILYDAEIRGEHRKALAVMRGDGYLFQLDRKTGKPLAPVEERAVPQLASQKTSQTQPFPVGAQSILMDCEEWRKKKIPEGFVLGCMWTPPVSPPPSNDPQNVLAPSPWVKGSPMAYSPLTGYFYVHSTSSLGWPRRSQDPYFLNWSDTVPGLKRYATFSAIDSRTGRIAWQKSLAGAYETGGAIATAGGLLFRASVDGNVEAYDAKNGDVLWQFQTGMSVSGGSPASYVIDNEQYIAVNMGPAVWAFKLGGAIAPVTVPPQADEEPEEFSGLIVDTHQIETTSLVRSLVEPGLRYFVDEYAFNPYRTRIKVGDSLLFVNNGVQRHELAAVDSSWSTGKLSPTQQVWLKFDKPGAYAFICKDHPWTYGQIIVTTPEITAEDSERKDSGQAASGSDSLYEHVRTGRESFSRHCSSCHGEELRGRGMAPPLSGDNFLSRWEGRTASNLFQKIRKTMPQQSPGSLDDQTYLDIVIYLLRANDNYFDNGVRKVDSESLENIAIRKTYVR